MHQIQVKGMKCAHCSDTVKKALEGLAGITAVTVDLDSGQVSYDGDVLLAEVKAVIEARGYQVVS